MLLSYHGSQPRSLLPSPATVLLVLLLVWWCTQYGKYFTWLRRLEMLLGVATGMMFLHRQECSLPGLSCSKLFVASDGTVSQETCSLCGVYRCLSSAVQ